MAILTKDQIKDTFKTGDTPSQTDFANFIDSTQAPLTAGPGITLTPASNGTAQIETNLAAGAGITITTNSAGEQSISSTGASTNYSPYIIEWQDPEATGVNGNILVVGSNNTETSASSDAWALWTIGDGRVYYIPTSLLLTSGNTYVDISDRAIELYIGGLENTYSNLLEISHLQFFKNPIPSLIAIGQNISSDNPINSVLIGEGLTTSNNVSNVTSIGENTQISISNSVAVGSGSSATTSDVSDGTSGIFAVGSSGSERRIVHVRDGVNPTDAATIGQMTTMFGTRAINSEIASATPVYGGVRFVFTTANNTNPAAWTVQNSSAIGTSSLVATPTIDSATYTASTGIYNINLVFSEYSRFLDGAISCNISPSIGANASKIDWYSLTSSGNGLRLTIKTSSALSVPAVNEVLSFSIFAYGFQN